MVWYQLSYTYYVGMSCPFELAKIHLPTRAVTTGVVVV